MFLRFEQEYRRRKIRSDSKNLLKRKRRLKSLKDLKPCLIAICRCDVCNDEFKIVDHVKEKSKRKHHFCSRQCKCDAQKQGGILCQKMEQTCLDNHGVKCGLLKSSALERALESSHTLEAEIRRSESLKRYHRNKPFDWSNPGNTPTACVKRHQTMKQNGSYRKSIVEDALYAYLCDVFGRECVNRNVLVNDRWPIDFYVSSNDTYYQLDGVYWHGLDRPIEVIAEHKTARDVQIHKKWQTDREQNKWFIKNKMKLIRLTDQQFLSGMRPL